MATETNARVTPPNQVQPKVRTDIQALRALAVTLVVGTHLSPGLIRGGFIGVDVFFVISGFLMTTQLLGELESRRTIRLGQFWLRRVLRLLPASLLVLGVSLAAVIRWVPQSRWDPVLEQFIGSAVYVQNWVLSSQAANYFTSRDSASPLAHYWSLSVEEQFYVVWPVLLLAGFVLASRSRRGVLLAIVGLTAISLAWAMLDFARGDLSYFASQTRAWELGIGGCVAGFAPRLGRLRPGGRIPSLLGWSAWGLLVATGLLYTENVPFPGPAALAPVLATALLLAVNSEGPALTRQRVVQWVGDNSYGIYLWHWPPIILVPLVTGTPLTRWEKVAILIGVLAVAAGTKILVEDPVRRLRFKSHATLRRGLALIAATTAGIVAITGLVQWNLGRERAAATTQLEARAHSSCFAAAAMAPGNHCKPGHTLKGDAGRLMSVDAQDTTVANGTTCQQDPDKNTILSCSFGAPAATASAWIALTGDSHAGHWSQALNRIAVAHNWRVLMMLRSSCPAALSDQIAPVWLPSSGPGCHVWEDAAVHRIAEDPRIKVVVTSSISREYHNYRPDGSPQPTSTAPAYEDAWKLWTAAGKSVVAISDIPWLGLGPVPDCIARSAPHDPCTAPRAIAAAIDPIRQAVDAAHNSAVFPFDPTNFLCDRRLCHAVVGGVPVYFDESHMTTIMSRSFAPYLDPVVDTAMARALASH